jgi:membrane protein DedA with SNARE-associated domain
MRFRAKLLCFAAFTVGGGLILWCLPSPVVTISAGAQTSTNSYRWWLAGAWFLIVGCGLEYFWSEGIDIVQKRLSRKEEIIAAGLLLLGILTAIWCEFAHYYHR